MSTPEKNKVDQYNDLMCSMARAKEQWEEEDGLEDEQDRLLSNAIDLALQQGSGWGPGEKEAYLEKILADDFVPPLFATSAEEVEKAGLTEAFTSLIYDGETPTQLMSSFRKKGNDAFANGKRNEANNKQYYRDAINHYIEAFAWAEKIVPLLPGDLAVADTDDPIYTESELNELKSTLLGNVALAHLQLKNWGRVRDEAKKALTFNKDNVKAWYRLAKAHQMMHDWEEAGDAVDAGLAVKGEENNQDLKKLQVQLSEKVRKARQQRQQRERNRALRVSRVKEVWKHCSDSSIRLGRVALVASVADDEEEDDERIESRWHFHLPHSGELPSRNPDSDEWTWPCMLLYPSHNQSDFIKDFGESELIAMRLAMVFPELENEGDETSMPWDFNNEFVCSSLAIYFEVHGSEDSDGLVHPENVEILPDQAATMRFYESSRALKGDEGADIANVVRAAERKHLHKQRKAWKKKHGSLWAKPDPNPVVRVHPAMSLGDVLRDPRMIVPNFLVTFIMIPENHPAHEAYLSEHKCIGLLQPKEAS